MRTPLDPGEVARFRDLVQERVGLAFPESRLPDVEWAVRKAVAESGLPDAAALYRLLVTRPFPDASLDALVSGLNVSETHFFRDTSQIHALEQRILPELLALRRPERRLRVWSVACSTGEEAYTLAILILQQLAGAAGWDVSILATDVNGRALERARRGVYGPWSFRGVPARVKDTWFIRDADHYEVVPQLRALVTFEQVNLVDGLPLPFPKADLVLCRNVLLYFDDDTGRVVVRRLGECLADGGWLLLGQTEAAHGAFDGLDLDSQGGGAFRKARPTVAAPRQAPTPPPAAPPARTTAAAPPPRVDGAQVPPGYTEAMRLWRQDRPDEALRRLRAEGSRDQLAAPLHYLQGLILLDEGRPDMALEALRRCTFADPGFALGHLAQAGLFMRAGKQARAWTELEHAASLVADLDPGERVFPGDELRAGALLELVDAQRQVLRLHPEPRATDD